MHTIPGAQDQPILVMAPSMCQRAVRPRLHFIRPMRLCLGHQYGVETGRADEPHGPRYGVREVTSNL